MSEPCPRRVLAPVDLESGPSEAVEVAAQLARALEGSLMLFAVVPVAAPAPGVPEVISPDLTEPGEQASIDRIARERLDQVAARVGDGLDVRTELGWGPTGPAVVDALEDGDYDMVVIPSRREGALAHLAHDHVLRQVLHHSPVPVLVVPAAAAPDQ